MTTPEFSRPILVDRVQGREVSETIVASNDEREALARRFDLQSIGKLEASLRLRRVRGDQMIEVLGQLTADVVQACVVTLEPVPEHVEEEFTALYAPAELVPEFDPDAEINLDELLEDAPEPFENGRVDLGELVAQHLSLALDPYPRAPGVSTENAQESQEDDKNPFAALARFKSRQ